MWSIPELMRLGARFASDELLCRRTRSLVTTAGALLPDAFSIGCFECRLNDEERVDVLACTVKGDGAQPIWRRRSTRGSVGRLLAAWARSPQAALAGVSAIWLEFDVEAGAVAAPFAFLRVAGLERRTSMVPTVAASASALQAALPEDWRERLLHIEQALPAGGKVLDFAIVPRTDVAVRLHLSIPPARLLRFLGSIGWAGPTATLERVLPGWSAIRGSIALQLQVGTRLEPWLDLEFLLDEPPKKDARWRPMLGLLRDQRLARKDKLNAAVAFVDRDDLPRDWPLRVERRLQVKVRVSALQAPSAKAYLAFVPRFSLT